LLLLLVLAVAGCASGMDTAMPAAPPATVAGRWTGQCFNCQATGFTMVLNQNGADVTGTVIAAGRHAFGDSAKPIINGRVRGNRFTFEAKGDPGDLWQVDVTTTPDGKTMEGTGYYNGSFGLRFTRQ
jgi:Tfp pilus tip-associated adhesin PilY1